MDAATPASGPSRLLSSTAIAHGLYWTITGIWPLISIGTFQLITGPKHDLWLVKTTGALIGAIGAVLMLAGIRRRITPEIQLLGAAGAVTLALADIVYVRRRVISPIYLADAVAELVLASLWIVLLGRDGRARGGRSVRGSNR